MRILGARGGTLVRVTLFAVVSAILTVLLAIEIGNLRLFADTYTLEAEFTDATGVFAGDAVKLSGVDVGRVTTTRIEDGKAVVSFEVDDDVQMTTESRVGIRWRNVLGLRYLYVFPSEEGEVLEDGDRIPVSQTDTAGDIGEFLNTLGPILQAIDPEKANAFLDAMNTALAGNDVTVRTLLTRGASLTDELADMDREIRSLITSSDKILGAYAGESRNLGKIIDDLDVVGGELRGMTGDINTLITNFAVVQEELERLMEESGADIDTGLRHLDAVTANLARRRGALEELLCSLPTGVAPYFQTTSWGEWFNVRIIEFVVKDDQGREIFSAGETRQNRPPRAAPVVECPDGRPTRVHYPGGDTSRGSASSASAGPEREAPRGGLAGWLDTVTGEVAGLDAAPGEGSGSGEGEDG